MLHTCLQYQSIFQLSMIYAAKILAYQHQSGTCTSLQTAMYHYIVFSMGIKKFQTMIKGFDQNPTVINKLASIWITIGKNL